jgi:hypothetical protein
LTDSQYKPGIGEFYGILNERIPFYTKNLLIFPTVAAQDSYSTNTLLYYVYRQTISRENPLYRLESIAHDRNSTRCKLFVAAQAARLPILAIAAADEKLPRVNKDGSNKKQEASHIFGGQMGKSRRHDWGYCLRSDPGNPGSSPLLSRYFVSDDSYLSTAELLRTIKEKKERSSLGTGLPLAEYLDSLEG